MVNTHLGEVGIRFVPHVRLANIIKEPPLVYNVGKDITLVVVLLLVLDVPLENLLILLVLLHLLYVELSVLEVNMHLVLDVIVVV
jgi:hypothetical protein